MLFYNQNKKQEGELQMKRKVLHSIFAAGLLTAVLFSTSYSASPVKAEEQQDAQTESISDIGDTAQLNL